MWVLTVALLTMSSEAISASERPLATLARTSHSRSVRWPRLQTTNQYLVPNPDLIFVGQVLRVPDRELNPSTSKARRVKGPWPLADGAGMG